MKRYCFILLLTAVVLLGGCSDEPAKPSAGKSASTSQPSASEPKEVAQSITGREAFQKLWIAARNWSPDAQPLNLESHPRKGDKRDGTASIWSASFASAQRGQVRNFLWSGAVGDGAPEPGITPGGVDVYSAGNASTQPFDPAILQADTDKVLTVADKRAPADATKDKNAPIKFQLYNDTAKQRLVWRVMYGGSEYNAKAIVDVHARDAGFVKVEK